MKKLILLILLYTIILPIFANDADVKLQNCIKEHNYSTSAMIYCTQKRTEDFKHEGDYILKSLQKSLDKDDYKKLLSNQKSLLKYENSINNTASKIMYSYSGTIYQTMEANFLYNLYKDNLDILKYLQTNNITFKDNANSTNIDTTSLKKLPQKDYKMMIKNQKEWNKYFKNIKNNVFTIYDRLYPQNSTIAKNIFAQKVIESRESLIQSIILPYQ